MVINQPLLGPCFEKPQLMRAKKIPGRMVPFCVPAVVASWHLCTPLAPAEVPLPSFRRARLDMEHAVPWAAALLCFCYSFSCYIHFFRACMNPPATYSMFCLQHLGAFRHLPPPLAHTCTNKLLTLASVCTSSLAREVMPS